MSLTLYEVLKEAEDILDQAHISEAKLDAWYLFESAFEIDRVGYFMNQHQQADQTKLEQYRNMIKQRSKHIPLQHITGVQEFMGLEFNVNENVLIPRQDTECLVERVLQYSNQKTVLDVCTGSGCIIITLSKMSHLLRADALDISEKALQVAKFNSEKHHAQVNFIESDLFSRIHEKYDIIVSNPPYIPTKVIEGLMEEVKEHEPLLALDGKEDGLFFYRRIVAQSKDFLNQGGMLFFEIGHDQGESVSSLMRDEDFIQVTVEQDLAGLDRVVYGIMP